MHVLFIHQAFPAQFGRLALELSKRYGWRCRFLIQQVSSCPTPSPEMLQTLSLRQLPLSEAFRSDPPLPWSQTNNRYLELCQAVYQAMRDDPEGEPDLVVAHGGQGPPILLIRDLVRCPVVSYCEYYFDPDGHADISYRIDLARVDPSGFYPRCINGPVLASLTHSDAGYSATRWQRASFPARFHPKIEVHFDGVDTELYRPRTIPPDRATQLLRGRSIPEGTRVVTYVARGLESMRGFDLFLRIAERIARARPDVLFVVVGREEIYYGWDKLRTGGPSFKEWALAQWEYDLSRFVFLDHVLPDELAELLCLSDLHLYLTVPFVLSWSLFNALACGRVVLASAVDPVLEVIRPGENGLAGPLFDVDVLTREALRVLDDPAAFAPLGRAARTTIEEHYSLEVAVPALRDFFEGTTTKKS